MSRAFFWLFASLVLCSMVNLGNLKDMRPLGRLHEKHNLPGLSPCEIEIGTSGNGRYVLHISREFPTAVVRPDGHPPNIHCKCTASHWAICFILVRVGSLEEKAVSDRLRHGSQLSPFKIIPSNLDSPKLVFTMVDLMAPNQNTVYAELQIINPEECNKVLRCVTIDGQTPAICPFTLLPFLTGDAVFIFEREFLSLMDTDDPLHCISAIGMRRILSDERTIREGGFEDPFGVFTTRLMKRQDFVGPIMIGGYDNTDICNIKGTPLSETSGSDSDSDYGLIFESNEEPPDSLDISRVEISTPIQRTHYFFLLILILIIFTLLSTSYSSKRFPKRHLSVEFLSSTPL